MPEKPNVTAAKHVPQPIETKDQQKPLPPKPEKPKTILIYESESFKSKGKRN